MLGSSMTSEQPSASGRPSPGSLRIAVMGGSSQSRRTRRASSQVACLGSRPCVGSWRADDGIRLLGLVVSDACRVVWDYGIHPKDAIHVASAMTLCVDSPP